VSDLQVTNYDSDELTEKVAEDDQEEATPVVEEVEEDTDPQEALVVALQEQAEAEEKEATAAAERERKEAATGELRHLVASGLVDKLFVGLAALAGEHTSTKETPTKTSYEQYAYVQGLCDELGVHDRSFPKSIAQGRYPSIDMSDAANLYWANALEKWIAVGEPYERFMRGVYGAKTHDTPFSTEG